MGEKVTGYIDHVIFRNEENGYTVMVMKAPDSEEELTCVGTFPDITQGVTIEAEGQFSPASRIWKAVSYPFLCGESTGRYHGHGTLSGIRCDQRYWSGLAARIVRCFGEDTFRIVEEEPERLAEVKGISEKKAREIASDQVTEKADMRKAMMFFQKYGISLNLGAKIYQKYGQSVYSVLQENPYRLADDISWRWIQNCRCHRFPYRNSCRFRLQNPKRYAVYSSAGFGRRTYLSS